MTEQPIAVTQGDREAAILVGLFEKPWSIRDVREGRHDADRIVQILARHRTGATHHG